MDNFRIKIIIAVLWISNTVIDLIQIVLSSMNSRWITDIMNGTLAGFPINDATIGVFAFSMVVPIFMAYLVLAITNEKVNKWLNTILVVIIGLMSWIDFLQRSPFEIGVSNWLVALATNIPLTIAFFYCLKLNKQA